MIFTAAVAECAVFAAPGHVSESEALEALDDSASSLKVFAVMFLV